MAGLDTVMSGLPGEAMSFLLWNSGSQAEFWTGASVVVCGLRKDPGRPDAQGSIQGSGVFSANVPHKHTPLRADGAL